MDKQVLIHSIQSYLEELCVKLPHRLTGTPENRRATTFFRETAESLGLETESQLFSCFDWNESPARLTAGGEEFPVRVSPYSLSFSGEAELVLASNIDELVGAAVTGRIVLLRGDIAAHQIMPKNFVFYNPDEHKRIVSLLEEKRPAAIIAATGRDPDLAGGAYPFPLFEDGDFNVPSVYMKDIDGERLAGHAGATVSLSFDSERVASSGENIIAARPGRDPQRIVVTAHIDSKKSTPGATDNAGGVAVLLALGELLSGTEGPFRVELTALNGEDYYSVPGQMLYLEKNRERMDDIMLAVNLDGAGYAGAPTAWSTYGTGNLLETAVRKAVEGNPGFIAGEPWSQGDHMIFAMSGRPAVAITTGDLVRVSRDITHTGKDTIETVDPVILADLAIALKGLILLLENE